MLISDIIKVYLLVYCPINHVQLFRSEINRRNISTLIKISESVLKLTEVMILAYFELHKMEYESKISFK